MRSWYFHPTLELHLWPKLKQDWFASELYNAFYLLSHSLLYEPMIISSLSRRERPRLMFHCFGKMWVSLILKSIRSLVLCLKSYLINVRNPLSAWFSLLCDWISIQQCSSWHQYHCYYELQMIFDSICISNLLKLTNWFAGASWGW